MPDTGLLLDLREVGEAHVAVVGGKGAHLGALSRIDGVTVPPGFCVTTEAFRRIVAPSLHGLLDRLSGVAPDDREAVRALSAEVRRTVEAVAVPDDLAAAVTDALAGLGDDAACAVRSSATAEDLPTASFAGQQDTYLNVVGPASVLRHVSRCWASLFTERAVTYRQRHGIDHRAVDMAVVVQRMVFPQAAGVLFTADPVTSDRRTTSVEATLGLGEALVSGLVTPDVHTVRDDAVVARAVGTKKVAIVPSPGGGTEEQAVDPALQDRPALTDAQVVALARLGRRIEAHFGSPQDVEWCLVDGGFVIVQSRPITTLFPVPETSDGENHVYLSVGHQQMMTDPMRPLGLSFWQMTTPAPMAEAGGRLFVDVTRRLASPAARDGIVEVLGRSDPLTGDALRTLLARDGFLRPLPDAPAPAPLPGSGTTEPPETDPAIVTELIGQSRESVAAAERAIAGLSGEALLDVVESDLQELRRILFDPRSNRVFLSAMEAVEWLNDRLHEWLGEKNAADVLTQSVPHNVTSEMGLALLDVADAIRPHPEVVAFLEQVEDDDFLDELSALPGGHGARDAVEGWLDEYGARCVGEIDITRPRWSEHPSALVPVILGHVRNFEPGAAARRFEQGLQEARAKEQDVLERLRALPGGEEKAAETEERIERVRTFIGYREYPKFGMVRRYAVYKRALTAEAERLVRAGVLRTEDDVHFLRFSELRDVVRTGQVDEGLLARRREAFRTYAALTPPRVLTSDGEALTGSYRRDDVPPGALVGLPVSAGTVEGRARIVPDIAQADLEPGDILVTAFTDPSWTPLFVAVAGLVTEVGGLMTHGAVIAREYGLPAVVGVVDATRLLVDGQRIRVHGTDGFVEVLA
ncbi:phosphoenolpyruvate synthase [Pseudonocardia sp. KRD-184]|uniref:Phosphoenolpyruvate synthase n=1 Tax=Pseudonocardia oceani TaxID=2792013 RepID=A0ABS6UA67_9PSEU|nr:rifamycin-inactivating phosphotransferase [Pseudonocardia oceani]MBW0092443.1 phosphoenolpyruvate synthase [Pseudonocardia oceani]MBW0099504.1 phosphoenolpyruvate synthase [Pseudonocardia oceani]MBW0112122.1 phosphoenolpyruvate synthase [Pseudonocardia oceani]MBW0124908.1 phosphoenolpyruvate synthase [Pseudonocardia oceani]MBW0128774.1 phosphoenolpyruvate synthase [Pseudonocardia oceani]